ncbi:CmcJ/NvfI family oxidoreductase [Ampullimonas aquatilis]|uniref:CmcJ/NvfI family oxidoreductase n=1 Tax=Ampullimonas aquatilis TaxID=1341549 RepID=UPI003C765941
MSSTTTDSALHHQPPRIRQAWPIMPKTHIRRVGSTTAEPAFVKAQLDYLLPMNERPFNFMYQPPNQGAWHNCAYESRQVMIGDARTNASNLSIDREGFELWHAKTAVRDFYDQDEVVNIYYPEIAEIARYITGASRAYVFDHLVRKREAGRPPMNFGRRLDGQNPGTAGRVHNDYSAKSGQERLGMVLQSAEQVTEVKRFSIINLWRAIKHPVLDTPLAVCDARSVAQANLVASDIIYPSRRGEIYLANYHPNHQWSYFSAMTRDEILVFKQFDSRENGVARFTPHAAFDHPDMPIDAPLRESIEIRCLLVHE